MPSNMVEGRKEGREEEKEEGREKGDNYQVLRGSGATLYVTKVI